MMMLSTPKLMGATALAVIVAFGSGWFQRDMLARVTVDEPLQVEQTATVVTEPAPEREEEQEREMVAMPPSRVVESAGFPVVPGPVDADAEAAQASGPIVTVNGRPLGSDEPVVASAPEPEPMPAAEPEEAEEQVAALAEPPRPIPRPEGLTLPQASQQIDNSVTASISSRPAVADGFMSLEDRVNLGPVAGQRPPVSASPNDDLVSVVGANGQVVWVHADRAGNVGQIVPVPVRPSGGNQFGFVYDDFEYRW